MDPAPALYVIRINGHLGAPRRRRSRRWRRGCKAPKPCSRDSWTVGEFYGVLAEVEALKTFGVPVVHSTVNVASGRGQRSPNSPTC